MKRWVAVVLVLTGCLPNARLHMVGPAEQVLPELADRCGVAAVEGLVGQPFVSLAEVDLPGALRVLYPGQVVTAEVQATRLNAAVDDGQRILRVFCG